MASICNEHKVVGNVWLCFLLPRHIIIIFECQQTVVASPSSCEYHRACIRYDAQEFNDDDTMRL